MDIDSLQDGIHMSTIKGLVNKDNPLILECGANDGGHTLAFIETFPDCTIHCFEPNPESITAHRQNISDPRCKLVECAIGAQDGWCELHLAGAASTIKGFAEKTTLDTGKVVRVRVRSLDSWYWMYLRPRIVDFIWADVEGAVEDLILGGSETLKHTRYFYTEYRNSPAYKNQIDLEQIQKLLPDFALVEQFRYDVLFKNTKLQL